MFRRGRGRHADQEAELGGQDFGDPGFRGPDFGDRNFGKSGQTTSGYPFRDGTGADGLGSLSRQETAAAPTVPASGPFDSSIVPPDDFTRVSLGALRVPVLSGVSIHPQVENNHVSAIVLVHGSSAMQVIPFAAPADDSAWVDIRHDLRVKLEAENYSPRECEGEFDVELLANLPSQHGRQLVRFLGIDGPRWFIRAMFTGAAASDPVAGQPLIKALRNTVVVRGNEPRPVRDPLPMHLPERTAPAAQKSVQQKSVEQPQARVTERRPAALGGRRLTEETLSGRGQTPARSPYLADATYRERFGPVADETIEIRGLPFADDDELVRT